MTSSERLMGTIEPKPVVTNILLREGLILVLKRSQMVGSFRGKWAGCSGYVEPDETIQEASYKELIEETGYKQEEVELVVRGEPFLVEKPHGAWLIHPHLYRAKKEKVRLDWEHTEYRWLPPEELSSLDTVPGLIELVEGLLSKVDRTE